MTESRCAKRPVALVLFTLLVGLCPIPGSQAATPRARVQQEATASDLDRALIETSLKDARALDAVEGNDRREQLILRLSAALASIDERSDWLERAAALRARAAAAPEQIAGLEAVLAKEPDAAPPVEFDDIVALEAARADAELDVKQTKADAERLDAIVRDAPERRLELAEEVARTEGQLLEQQEALDDIVAPDESADLAAARRVQLQAQTEELGAKLSALRVEDATFDVRRSASEAELRLARRVAAAASARLDGIEDVLSLARRRVAEEQQAEAARAREAALMQGQAFQRVAENTLALRSETLEITETLDTTRAQLERVNASLERLNRRYEDTQKRIDITGLTSQVGLRLRQDRQRFLDARRTSTEFSDIDERLTTTQLALFDIDIASEALVDDDRWIDTLVDLAKEEAVEDARAVGDVRPLARNLLADLRAALAAKRAVLDDQFEYLSNLKAARGALDQGLAEYEDFVAERILWIRSSNPIWDVEPGRIVDEVAVAVDAEKWVDAAESVERDLIRRPAPILGVVLLLACLLLIQRRVHRGIAAEGVLAEQRSQVSIKPSLRALALTLVAAAPVAAILFALVTFAGTVEQPSAFVAAAGGACEHAAAAALIVGLLRAMTLPKGLGPSHFEWQESGVAIVRRQAAWLLLIMPIAAFVGEFFASIEASSPSSTAAIDLLPIAREAAAAAILSRTAFLVEAGSLLVFLWRVLHPSRGVLAFRARGGAPDDWLTRLRRLWFLLFVGLVLVLMVVTLLGYEFTARSLFSRLEFTLGYLLLLLVLRSLALRWVRLERRREALEKLRRKREELREKRLAEIERRRNAGEDFEELESEGLEVHKDEVDFAALSSDVRDVVRMFTGIAALVGVFLIWSTVLPALGVLDGVRLWSQEGTMTSAVADASGLEKLEVTSVQEWITLGNVLTAILALILTWRAVKDLPSLLEIVLLRRLDLGSGERYAITTLLRYFLTVVGLAIAFNELGLSWSKLQWLVAGVSVGLGFGLQEIFANFVSGITLLFERPIRVGDWVTLGEIEGVVSKIRIRATTIRDRDLKELIVPNREFITGRFINWTLSDPVSRVTLPVGIAYGSDTERAIQLLLDAGRDCSFSVAEPAPNVVFKSFGGSSLDFELRVFVTGREIMPRVVHDLHLRVDAAFRRAEIEISFPQLDLHVRTGPPLQAPPSGSSGDAAGAGSGTN